MPYSFDTRKTYSSKALKISSFPLLRYANFISQFFFYLFLLSLLSIVFSFFGLTSNYVSLKISVLFLFLFLLFLELRLFADLKIKKFKPPVKLSEEVLGESNCNLAEFLSLDLCNIVESSIKISKRGRFSEVSSESLLYSALLNNKDVKTLVVKLGINASKLQSDLKNYLEKQPRGQKFNLVLSESFMKTMEEAARLSVNRKHDFIDEKEVLVGLAKNDQFFKQILIEYEVKEKDIEDLTLWLENLEVRISEKDKFWLKENLASMGSLGKDFSSGYTVTLDSYSIDWREVVSRKEYVLDIVGHEKEVKDLETILTKSSRTNALIVGEEGMGKKSIIESLAQRCYLEESLPELNDQRVVELDMVQLISRIQSQEKLEETLDQIFQEIVSSGNVILVIDKIDNYVNQRVQKPGEIDISVILSKYLPISSFRFVGITSYDGLHRKLEQNPSFLEYFSKIEVSEVSEADTIRILQDAAISLEHQYGILIVYTAIREIINLTSRYMPSTPFPKKAIDILYETASHVKALKEKILQPSHVAKIISDKTQIPIGKLEFKEKSVLLDLENSIHKRIVNQKEAVNEISIAMRRARSGISSKKRPMGSFLFLGPTGVGKTETAKALAEIYFGGENKMIRIDMSEFQSIEDIPRLIGAISPVEEQGLLTTPVRENPFSLVLLDEIEKAHKNILNLFLQVLDEGHITDGQGRKVMFTNTIIICTSNAGANMIFNSAALETELNKDELLNSIFQEGIFKPEFVNRFDATVIFHSLTKDNLKDIAQLMLGSLAKSLGEKDIEFIITDQLKEKIVGLSYKPEFGAREMRRVIQDKVENKVAEALLSDKIVKGNRIEINPDNFEIIVLQNNDRSK